MKDTNKRARELLDGCENEREREDLVAGFLDLLVDINDSIDVQKRYLNAREDTDEPDVSAGEMADFLEELGYQIEEHLS